MKQTKLGVVFGTLFLLATIGFSFTITGPIVSMEYLENLLFENHIVTGIFYLLFYLFSLLLSYFFRFKNIWFELIKIFIFYLFHCFFVSAFVYLLFLSGPDGQQIFNVFVSFILAGIGCVIFGIFYDRKGAMSYKC